MRFVSGCRWSSDEGSRLKETEGRVVGFGWQGEMGGGSDVPCRLDVMELELRIRLLGDGT